MSTDEFGWPNIRFDYGGCHVLVTGGTSGIGAGIAAAYAQAGAQVTVTGTRPRPSDYAVDLGAYRYRQLDVLDNAQVDALGAAMPRLDILINNAGIAWVGGGYGEREYEPDVYEQAVRMHLLSPYRLAYACREKLAESKLPGGASIIGIASMASLFGIEVVPGYGAGKAGLVQMTKTLAIAWARHRIRVNAVAAGITESGMTAAMLAMPEAMAPVLARTPLGRVGKPSDVAGAVLFLTSPAAAYITGQTLPIDGGYSVVG